SRFCGRCLTRPGVDSERDSSGPHGSRRSPPMRPTNTMTDVATRPRMKVTYATLRNDNEELHAAFDHGLEQARALLGQYHRNVGGGQERDGDGTFEKRSPIDGEVLGTFAKGTRKDVQDAIAAARAAFPAWGHRPWQERVAIMRKVADVISERQMLFSALMA